MEDCSEVFSSELGVPQGPATDLATRRQPFLAACGVWCAGTGATCMGLSDIPSPNPATNSKTPAPPLSISQLHVLTD